MSSVRCSLSIRHWLALSHATSPNSDAFIIIVPYVMPASTGSAHTPMLLIMCAGHGFGRLEGPLHVRGWACWRLGLNDKATSMLPNTKRRERGPPGLRYDAVCIHSWGAALLMIQAGLWILLVVPGGLPGGLPAGGLPGGLPGGLQWHSLLAMLA